MGHYPMAIALSAMEEVETLVVAREASRVAETEVDKKVDASAKSTMAEMEVMLIETAAPVALMVGKSTIPQPEQRRTSGHCERDTTSRFLHTHIGKTDCQSTLARRRTSQGNNEC